MSNIKRYNGTSWEKIPIMADKATSDVYGNNISTTYAKKADVYTNTETDSKLSAKQDKLISGTNIKTINGSNILGSGNITISASVPTASSTTLGGIKIGHVNDGLVPVEYPVVLDSENKAYVSVPIYEYHGTTYGYCYAIDSPNDAYSMQIGSSGFTVDVGDTYDADSNLLQVSSDKFQYRQSDVMTGETKYLQSKYFKHWHGMFVCPSNTYYYRLIAKATNSGSSVILYQTITIRGTIGGWGSSEQCEFMYVVALRNNNFSAANNIRKTIFRGSTYTEESTIASNTGIDIVTHRDSSSGALYVYLRSYGAQKYSQYDIIVTADGWDDVVTLPTDENFYTSSSGTLVSGSQLLSSTQNQCIEITNKNLVTINGHSLIGSGNLGIPTYPGDNFFIKRVASYSNGACLYKRPSGQTSLPRLYNVLTPWNVYLILPYQSPWFTFNYGDLRQWPAIAFLEIASGYNFFLRVYIKDSPYVYEWQNEDMSTNVVAFWNCTIYKIGR